MTQQKFYVQQVAVFPRSNTQKQPPPPQTISVAGAGAHTRAIGTAVVTRGQVTVTTTSAVHTRAFGTAVVTRVGVLIQTIVDPFTSSLRTTIWKDNHPNAVWDSSGGGRIKLPCTTAYPWISTSNVGGYNLTGSYLFARVVVPPTGTGTRETYMEIYRMGVSNDKVHMFVSGGTLYARKTVGGANAGQFSATYDPVAHAWWRIRESGGTVFFDTSADGITWTNFWSTTPGFVITDVWAGFSCGYYGTESAADGYVDNVNVPTQAVTSTSVVHTRAFGTAVVSRGSVTLRPSGVAHTRAFGTATVVGATMLSPSSVVHQRAFGTAVLSRGSVTVTTTSAVHTRAFGTAVVTRGPVTTAPSSVIHTRGFGVALVTVGGSVVATSSVIHTRAFGSPTVVLIDPTQPPNVYTEVRTPYIYRPSAYIMR